MPSHVQFTLIKTNTTYQKLGPAHGPTFIRQTPYAIHNNYWLYYNNNIDTSCTSPPPRPQLNWNSDYLAKFHYSMCITCLRTAAGFIYLFKLTYTLYHS